MSALPHIAKKHWQHYLTRPGDMLFASLWASWNTSAELRSIVGATPRDFLAIEEKKGLLRGYFAEEQYTRHCSAIRKFALTDSRCTAVLIEAQKIEKEAERRLARGADAFSSLYDTVQFLEHVFIYTTSLPYRFLTIAETNAIGPGIFRRSQELRTKTLYPAIIERIVRPFARAVLRKNGITQPVATSLSTVGELLAGDMKDIPTRVAARAHDKQFVYQYLTGTQSIKRVLDTSSLIRSIEKEKYANDLRGKTGFPGKATGIARVILSHTGKGQTFNRGDILVSIHSSPTLMPFIRKAGALVTDEGGLSCHAAVISRELKIPCVMATKYATSVIHGGDRIEVDAVRGVVRILGKNRKTVLRNGHSS